ncbi:hypothetical protein D3C72_1125550 [compost metagenome]
MEETKKTCKKGKVGQIADGYLEVAQLFATPSIFLRGQPGYGLPMGSELANATQKIDTEGKRSEEIAKTAQEISDSLISAADIRELDLIKANLTTLRTIIRPAKPAPEELEARKKAAIKYIEREAPESLEKAKERLDNLK